MGELYWWTDLKEFTAVLFTQPVEETPRRRTTPPVNEGSLEWRSGPLAQTPETVLKPEIVSSGSVFPVLVSGSPVLPLHNVHGLRREHPYLSNTHLQASGCT